MLQCVAMRYCVMPCVALRCSVLQHVLQYVAECCSVSGRGAALNCSSVLQHVAVCCSVLQCITLRCSVFQYVAVRDSVLY